MRYSSIIRLTSVALIACVAATAAFSDPPDKAVANFEPLGASGISGDARFQSQTEGTLVHLQLRGLEPNSEYVAVIFQNATCSAVTGDMGTEIVTFRANPAGIANQNLKIPQELGVIGSVAIWPGETTTAVACGAVNPVE